MYNLQELDSETRAAAIALANHICNDPNEWDDFHAFTEINPDFWDHLVFQAATILGKNEEMNLTQKPLVEIELAETEAPNLKEAIFNLAEYIAWQDPEWDSLPSYLSNGNAPESHILFHATKIMGTQGGTFSMMVQEFATNNDGGGSLSSARIEDPMEETTLFIGLAKDGHLPEDFNQWSLADEHGWTVAHEAAKHGHLPVDFEGWSLEDNFGQNVAHVAAKYDNFPKGFDWEDIDWDRPTNAGVTVAHYAALSGCLPADLNAWGWRDDKGRSVAHYAARKGLLPEGFRNWTWEDNRGNTVAHVAAKFGQLPADFFEFNDLSMPNGNGETLAHIIAKHGPLPEDFIGWAWRDIEGNTVAHVAARYGHLPEDYLNLQEGDLLDGQDQTVREVFDERANRPRRAASGPKI